MSGIYVHTRRKSQSQSALMTTVMIPLCDRFLPLLYRVGVRVVFPHWTPPPKKPEVPHRLEPHGDVLPWMDLP